ncbi:MAG: hypothetical protein R2780_14545 [Crocinitomicaceae bacterium]|nr:hypothetical protein [Crocinitomicaceae bacterium]
MKKQFLLIFLILSAFLIQAQTVYPYVKLKSGEVIKYDEVTIKGKVKARNEGDQKWVKYKGKDLKSAVGGMRTTYLRKRHTQVMYFKIDLDNIISGKGTIVEGKKAYQVIISNGNEMILCNQIYSPKYTQGPTTVAGMPSTMGSTTMGGGSQTAYYFVEGSNIRKVTFDWYKKDFIESLKTTFGSECDCVDAVVDQYQESKLKFITIYELMENLKDCYYLGCFKEL